MHVGYYLLVTRHTVYRHVFLYFLRFFGVIVLQYTIGDLLSVPQYTCVGPLRDAGAALLECTAPPPPCCAGQAARHPHSADCSEEDMATN